MVPCIHFRVRTDGTGGLCGDPAIEFRISRPEVMNGIPIYTAYCDVHKLRGRWGTIGKINRTVLGEEDTSAEVTEEEYLVAQVMES